MTTWNSLGITCILLLAEVVEISTNEMDNVTYGGTSGGAPCVFPFTYGGQQYSQCIPYMGYRWCATVPGAYETNRKWAKCGRAKPEQATFEGNANAAPCAFPFSYNGTEYTKCIPDKDYLWCATVPGAYETHKKWGKCTSPNELPARIYTFGGNASRAACLDDMYPCQFGEKPDGSGKGSWCMTEVGSSPKWGECHYEKTNQVTFEGNDNGVPCAFPFSYNGQDHWECAYHESYTWCRTSPELYDYPENWAKCPSAKMDQPTYGEYDKGVPCAFPFSYEGQLHTQCIPDEQYLWCATLPGAYETHKKWAKCPSAKVNRCNYPAFNDCATDLNDPFHCYSREQTCDGIQDCPNGDDEKDCNGTE